MNDAVRQILFEIVQRHGKSIVEDIRRCEGLLRDYLKDARRETAVLTMALEEGVARDLNAAPINAPHQGLLARLVRRLCDNLALSEEAARWAVNSWALALGVITAQELKSFENQNLAQNQTPKPGLPAPIEIQKTQKIASRDLIIVSASGNGDFVSINEAIKVASAGAEILVRPGVYLENIILDKQIKIIGDESNQQAIIRSENSSCVSMQTERAFLKNLTLQSVAAQHSFAVDIPSGELVLEDCDVTSDSSACMAIHGASANPTIKNCRIHDGAGGGIHIFDGASGTIENCEIYQNQKANINIAQNANPTFKNCRIFAGGNIGFWVHQNGLGTIDECEIYEYPSPAVAVERGGSPVLRGCRIYRTNDAGVFVTRKGRILLEDCQIYEHADAGISIEGSSIAAISNCRVNQNGTVAVRVKENSSVRVENCDLRSNNLATWETEAGVFIENSNNLEY